MIVEDPWLIRTKSVKHKSRLLYHLAFWISKIYCIIFQVRICSFSRKLHCRRLFLDVNADHVQMGATCQLSWTRLIDRLKLFARPTMLPRPLLLLPIFAAVVSAAQLAVKNARVTISGNDGSQLASDRKSTRLNSSHSGESRMPSSA